MRRKLDTRSWAERLGRPALGTATCDDCGRVAFHEIPGPYNGAFAANTPKEEQSHTCRCGGRLSCGYSCEVKTP